MRLELGNLKLKLKSEFESGVCRGLIMRPPRSKRKKANQRQILAMPRGADVKVWNEDLVVALEARMYDAIARNNQRSFMWRKGADQMRRVKGDIYVCSTGRIVGLPKTWTSSTVQAEVLSILLREKDIIPHGFEKYDTRSADFHKPAQTNDIYSHTYLQNMHYRGGGYAILMAFDDAIRKNGPDFRGPMFKQQIIDAAQAYCDCEMQPNFQTSGPELERQDG
jgi:hypothetical protein